MKVKTDSLIKHDYYKHYLFSFLIFLIILSIVLITHGTVEALRIQKVVSSLHAANDRGWLVPSHITRFIRCFHHVLNLALHAELVA